MKRLLTLGMLVLLFPLMSSCSSTKIVPQKVQMNSICELAALECYYHNVAKYFEKDAYAGFIGIGKKDRHFWIEYSGRVKIGIDLSQTDIQIDGKVVAIKVPHARVLSSIVDAASLNEKSFIVAGNSEKVRAEDQTKAFAEAQANMEQKAAADKALLANAEERVKSLLTDYINLVSEKSGIQYQIEWKEAETTEKEAVQPSDLSSDLALSN